MKYAIGLDIGIESVGYAVLELDSHDQPFRIERLGSRVFDRAEHPKDGSSLAVPRRELLLPKSRTCPLKSASPLAIIPLPLPIRPVVR